MTESDWQNAYMIVSTRGVVWRRRDLLKRASARVRSLAPMAAHLAVRTIVQAVLDDSTFMRTRRGMVPARVIDDAAIEALSRLGSMTLTP